MAARSYPSIDLGTGICSRSESNCDTRDCDTNDLVQPIQMSLTSSTTLPRNRENRLAWFFGLLATILVLNVLRQILVNYVDYFPADFKASFLIGREAYFHGIYAGAFYVHIIVGPVALLSGMALVHTGFRRRFGILHAWVGRFQAINVIFLLAPSGAVMAMHAFGGAIAAVAFLLLSLITIASAGASVYHAVGGNIRRHRIWATRNLICLGSPVLLRLMSGGFIVLGIESESTYRFVAWSSWLLPLVVFETWRILKKA